MGGQLSDFEFEADYRSVRLVIGFDQAKSLKKIDVAADGSTADLSLAFGAPFAALNIGLQADRLPAMSTPQQARHQDRGALVLVRSDADSFSGSTSGDLSKRPSLGRLCMSN